MNTEELANIKITPLLDTLKLQKIDDEVYFTMYNGYISNSRLSLINPEQDGSPEKFFEGFKPTFSTSFELGSAIHELSLQNDRFILCDSVNKLTAKLGALADRLYPYFLKNKKVTIDNIKQEAQIIDYYSKSLTENKIQNVLEKCMPYWKSRSDFESTFTGSEQVIYLDKKSRETVYNCVKALKNNQYIQKLLHPTGIVLEPISEMEQAILLDIEVKVPNIESFTLSLKAKLDNYTIDTESNVITVNDVKSIGKIVSEINNNISKYRYNRELSIYSWLLSLCAKKYYNLDNPIIKGNYLVVSTIPQYYTKVVPMTKKMYKEGWNEFIYLLKLVAYYYAKGYRFK